jgi:hypothetical protein
VEKKKITVEQISTKDQLADTLLFQEQRDRIGVLKLVA